MTPNITAPAATGTYSVQAQTAAGSEATPSPSRPRRTLVAAALFIGLFGTLLASFPARNLDLWQHLAAGRELIRGLAVSSTWLYDLATYAIYSIGGGVGLAAAKALACGAIAVLLLWLARVDRGWRIALAATGLAVLAMSSRLLLQPATVSVLFLAIALGIIWRTESAPPKGRWPGWPLVALFVVWANVDAWVVLGLAVVALVRLGQWLDDRQPGGLGRWAAMVGVLVVAACLSPSHVNNLQSPAELRAGVMALKGSGDPVVNSPFQRAYFIAFRDSPAALAYYPLLALGLVSFLLNRASWRWAWFLPWLGVALVSALQVRTVPFFAVVAGPVLAWNLQGVFAHDATAAVVRPRVRYAALALTLVLAVAFLASGWTGWLQSPPYGPRQWAIEQPVALERGAEFLRRAHASASWASEGRTLHISPDTVAALSWFCPEDRGVRDDLLRPNESADAARARLRAQGVNRVVVHAAEPGARSTLHLLLTEPREWPVLHLTGGLAVFGWRDPAAPGGGDWFAEWEVDFDRLAFRPNESELAPASRPAQPGEARWWEAFWKRPLPRAADQDEAIVLIAKSEALARSAPQRHGTAWVSGQAAGLVGAAFLWGGGPASSIDATVRLNLIQPEGAPAGVSPPPLAQFAFALHERFLFERGHAPVGVLYAAVRAARRATAANPNDANAYLVLGQAYVRLLVNSAERKWAELMPEFRRIRQLQASAALNRAIALNPNLAQAHLELARLYPGLDCLDLAVEHLRTYRNLVARQASPRTPDDQLKAIDADVRGLSEVVDRATREFNEQFARLPLVDRATMASRRKLGGMARDMLLKSDIAAFGAQGMELELSLLVRTGRPDDVLEWTTEEVRGSLGDTSYYRLRELAHAALGDYADADADLATLIALGGEMPAPSTVSGVIGGMVGKALLDSHPGGSWLPDVAWRVYSRADFQKQETEIAQKLTRQCDLVALRGLLLLESGRIDQARAAFRASLVLFPNRLGDGQLHFGGRAIAWDCLGLIGP